MSSTSRVAMTWYLAGAGLAILAGCDVLAGLVDPEDPGDPPDRVVEGVTTEVAAIVGTFARGPLHRPFLLESMAEFDTWYGGVDPAHEASYQVRAFFQNGGRRIWVSRAAAPTPAGLLGGGVPGTGVLALDDANRFDLLLVPELFTSGQVTERAVAAGTAVAYAASRGAMMLLDPPAEVQDAQALVAWVNGSGPQLRSRHAALFHGRLQVPDPAGSGGTGGSAGTRWIGASGAAAGLYGWNDRERGVWMPPAGPGLPAMAGVQDTEALTTAEREALTQAQVNTLQRGPVRLWGARTLLQGDSPYTFVHVQRLATYLEARVREALAWTAGEPMGLPLGTRAQADAEAVLRGLWEQGAFQGTTMQEAFFARCDASTHTSADIAARRLKVVVGFAAIRPGEFVPLVITVGL
jgi:uncharacterized protein